VFSIEALIFALLVASAVLWCAVCVLPWRPWLIKPYLDANRSPGRESLEDITALIPARNEASLIRRTLQALASQGSQLRVVVVDDQSDDGTAGLAREAVKQNLLIVSGEPLPPDWSGKLWALEQGRHHIDTRYTLLIDADIELLPGIVASVQNKMKDERLQFVSLMAMPHMRIFWERQLMPAFVYFFKQLYPFNLSNSRFPGIAAAAGGFIMFETKVLDEIGGFAAIKDALIDDCTLARRVKEKGYRTWIGLTHSVQSLRAYHGLIDIWNMVERTAYTQLNYSVPYLLICTAMMLIGFVIPSIGLMWHPWGSVNALSLFVLAVMTITYLPTLRFYGRSPAWALAMPVTGALFLLMTWTSAFRYWLGQRAQWRGRAYSS
jgi:hopene-associated glycosyltransferase HpnB